MLLLDDPIGNLSKLEEKLQKKGVEVTRVWDASEAGVRFSEDHFDGVVASAICVPGDAATFCMCARKDSPHPIMTCIFAPYPLDAEDEKFLRGIGIDHILRTADDDGFVDALAKHASAPADAEDREACDCDPKRVMKISRSFYEAALKDLASRASKLEEILENASDVIYELDPYGRIILISKVIETLTGYTRDELIGMSALDVTSPESLEVVAQHISILLAGEDNPPPVEVGVMCRTGRVIPAEMIVRPIRHEDKVVGILGIGRNVEERKRLEENLRRTMNEKDFYLDLMAHDVQNFNQAIIGYLEMILAMEGLDPRLVRYAKGAFRQVMQTAQLIAHLKRVAQIRQSGRKTFATRDIKEILQRSITNLQSQLDKSTVALTLDCPEGDCSIEAGEDINDLLEIIVSAASRYSMSDILHLNISLSPELVNGDKYWRIEISGKNLRLSEPVVRCIMSQDFAGCQTIERPDLQLLVVRAIIETQDGTIEAKTSENGRGDRFVIQLPQA